MKVEKKNAKYYKRNRYLLSTFEFVSNIGYLFGLNCKKIVSEFI